MKPNTINNFFSYLDEMAEINEFHTAPQGGNNGGSGITIDVSYEVRMIREHIYMLENEINNTNDRIAVEKSIEEYVEEISNKIIREVGESVGQVLPTLEETVRKFNSIASSDWEDFEFALNELDSTLSNEFGIELVY